MIIMKRFAALAFAGALSIGCALAQTSPLTIAKGGTGAATAAAARTSLGLAIGTNVQAYDADLAAIAGLTTAADKCQYWTAAGAAALIDCKSWVRSFIAAADVSAGRTSLGLAIGTDVQAFDADLAALAANSTDGFWAHTGAGTGAARTLTAPAAGFTITNPAGIAGNPTFVLANDLAALEAMSGTGLVARTASETYAQRTITQPAAGITVSNGDGVAGNPTLALANDLLALEGLGSTGFAARTATDTWAQRTFQAPAAGFTITNPAGVAGDPTFVLANDLAALEGLTGTGTPQRTGVDTWAMRTASLDSNNDYSGLRNIIQSGYHELSEIASPSNPAADTLRVFAKDVAGATHLVTRDSAGTEIDLSAGGTGAGVTSITCGAGLSGGTITGTGTCAVQNEVLLETLTASTSASLSSSVSWSGYNSIKLVFRNVIPATTGVDFRMQVNAGGVQTTTYVNSAFSSAAGGALAFNTATTFIALNGGNTIGNANPGANGVVTLLNIASTTTTKPATGTMTNVTNGSTTANVSVVGGWWNGGNAAVTGVQFSMSSGNMTSGSIQIFGIQ